MTLLPCRVANLVFPVSGVVTQAHATIVPIIREMPESYGATSARGRHGMRQDNCVSAVLHASQAQVIFCGAKRGDSDLPRSSRNILHVPSPLAIKTCSRMRAQN